MDKKGVRSQRSAESVDKILQAAQELARELGYEGTTIAKVSKRSGLPTGSIYWHFGDKDKLFAALINRYVDAWFNKYDWTVREGERPVDRMTEIITTRAKEATDPSSAWGIGLSMALERRLEGSAARETFLEIRRSRLQFIAEFWRDNLPGNVLTADPELPTKLAQFVVAFSDGWFISASANEDWDLESHAGIMATTLDQMIGTAERKAFAKEGLDETQTSRWGHTLPGEPAEGWGL